MDLHQTMTPTTRRVKERPWVNLLLVTTSTLEMRTIRKTTVMRVMMMQNLARGRNSLTTNSKTKPATKLATVHYDLITASTQLGFETRAQAMDTFNDWLS